MLIIFSLHNFSTASVIYFCNSIYLPVILSFAIYFYVPLSYPIALFSWMAFPCGSPITAHHVPVLRGDFRKSSEVLGLKPNITLILFDNIDGKSAKIVSTCFCGLVGDQKSTLHHHLHHKFLDQSKAFISLQLAQPLSWTRQSTKKYHYNFHPTNDLPHNLTELRMVCVFAWGSLWMIRLWPEWGPEPSSFPSNAYLPNSTSIV